MSSGSGWLVIVDMAVVGARDMLGKKAPVGVVMELDTELPRPRMVDVVEGLCRRLLSEDWVGGDCSMELR